MQVGGEGQVIGNGGNTEVTRGQEGVAGSEATGELEWQRKIADKGNVSLIL